MLVLVKYARYKAKSEEIVLLLFTLNLVNNLNNRCNNE